MAASRRPAASPRAASAPTAGSARRAPWPSTTTSCSPSTPAATTCPCSREGRGGLRLADREPSGGDRPISVTVHDGLVYVVNAGGTSNVTGFRLGRRGDLVPARGLHPSPHRRRCRPGAGEFSPDGDTLVVTEKNTNVIDAFPVRRDGRLGAPAVDRLERSDPVRLRLRPPRPGRRERGVRRRRRRQRGLVVRADALGWAADHQRHGRHVPDRGLLGRGHRTRAASPTPPTPAATPSPATRSPLGRADPPERRRRSRPRRGDGDRPRPQPLEPLPLLPRRVGRLDHGLPGRRRRELAPVGTTTGLPTSSVGLVAE